MLENISRVEFWRSVSQFKKKTKESLCLVFRFSTKREIKEFHVVVVQWRQRNVQKYLMHVQSCCFAYLRARPHVFVFVWKRIFIFSGSAYLPHSLMQWKRSTKRTFSITLSRVEIFENLLGFSFTCGRTKTVSNSEYDDVIHHIRLA